MRMVRKQPQRGRGAPSAGRKQRRGQAWRLSLVLLVGVLLGIPIGYALPHGEQAQPSPGVSAAPSVAALTTAASTPPSASVAASPSLAAPSLRPADAPVAQPWHPAASVRPGPAAPAASGRPTTPPRVRPSASPRPRPSPRTYVVRPGDTFAGIAKRVYGTSGMADVLLRANPGIDPRALPLGRSLVVPPAPPSPRPTLEATPATAPPSAGPRPRAPRQAP